MRGQRWRQRRRSAKGVSEKGLCGDGAADLGAVLHSVHHDRQDQHSGRQRSYHHRRPPRQPRDVVHRLHHELYPVHRRGVPRVLRRNVRHDLWQHTHRRLHAVTAPASGQRRIRPFVKLHAGAVSLGRAGGKLCPLPRTLDDQARGEGPPATAGPEPRLLPPPPIRWRRGCRHDRRPQGDPARQRRQQRRQRSPGCRPERPPGGGGSAAQAAGGTRTEQPHFLRDKTAGSRSGGGRRAPPGLPAASGHPRRSSLGGARGPLGLLAQAACGPLRDRLAGC